MIKKEEGFGNFERRKGLHFDFSKKAFKLTDEAKYVFISMPFIDWMKDSNKHLGDAINHNIHNLDIFKQGTHKNQLLPYYLQYKMWKSNKSLVYATWGLAIVTIILAIVTLSIQNKGG